MNEVQAEEIKLLVREHYANTARQATTDSGCCGTTSSCCGTSAATANVTDVALQLGYSAEDVAAVPEGANLGLGCGNPAAIAAMQPGETVLDLGSGGGFDCFLAATQVGPGGHVIGVDMTHEMISLARTNARKLGHAHVEFRLGEIEQLPVADAVVDVIISNCVINLSSDKAQVFREAYRVLKPGGRLAISDVVATAALPEDIRADKELLAGCVGGAVEVGELEQMLTLAGFSRVVIAPKDESREFIREWVPGRNLDDYLLSATIEAIRPTT